MAPEFATKKCPYCSVNLGARETKCFSCHKPVGKANKHGVAEKPFDWKGYGLSILSVTALIFFIYYAFLRK